MALIAAAALLAGCTTTHALGRIDDPGTRAQLRALAAEGDDHAHLLTEPAAGRPPFGYRVTGVTPSGLLVEPTRGQSLVVPLSQVASLSRTDHWKGARAGALGSGICAFFTSAVLLSLLLSAFKSGCSDGCDSHPDDAWPLVRASAIVGLASAVVGGALGAAVGHEDRYIVTPP